MDQLAQQLVAIDHVALAQDLRVVVVGLRRAEAEDGRHAGDDDHVAAREERGRGGVAQPVDLLVDGRVLLDVEVLGRDVGLGLVVVVVGDEVLDRVVGEEGAELVAQLRGQRLVVGEHERGFCTRSMTPAIVIVLPVPVAPSSVTKRSPASTPWATPSIALGWSAAGVKMGSSRNSGTNPKTLATPADGPSDVLFEARFARSVGRACGHLWPSRPAPGPSPASPTTRSCAMRRATPSTASSAASESSTSPRWESAPSSAPESRHHRRGRRRRRAVDHRLLRARRGHVPVSALLLCRAGLLDPGLGQCIHLRVRDARRARGVDHRLGPDPRVRRVGGRGRRRLGRVPEVPARLALRHQPARFDRRPARRRRDRQPARRLPRARGDRRC